MLLYIILLKLFTICPDEILKCSYQEPANML